jgi:uncharacterized membrane protein YczE
MKKFPTRRFLVMCLGILIMGLGIGLFKLSLMGNDPSSAMVMAIGDRLGVAFSLMLIIMNTLFFVVELLFGRKYIGLGTFVNWFGVGILCDFYTGLITRIWTIPEGFLPRLLIMLVGILVLSLSASLYQTADLGISPYDSLSIILDEKLPIPYFWCRIFTDVVASAICWLLGGIVGLGTLVCALGLGPFIHFFNRHVSEKLVGVSKDA